MKLFRMCFAKTSGAEVVIAAETAEEAERAVRDHGIEEFVGNYDEDEGNWELDTTEELQELPPEIPPESFEDEGIEIDCGIIDGEFYDAPDTFEEAYAAWWEDLQKNPPPPPPDPNQLPLPLIDPEEKK